jgi:hypothetical protein
VILEIMRRNCALLSPLPEFFGSVAAVCLGASLVVLLILTAVKSLMGGVR